MPQLRIAIVGAGPSGLPATRHALLYNIEPVVFEATSLMGGLWNYKPPGSEETSIMKSTVMNSAKEISAYSDYLPAPEEANFMHNKRMLQYLLDYAKHFDLEKYIRYNTRVINVKRSSSFDATGQWDVEFEKDGKTSVETFDGVLICTGHHQKVHYPEKWPGQDSFTGKIIHSHNYKEPAGYERSRVVAVGLGNSGGDVAVEMSRVADKVYLSTRRGAWIFNRLQHRGAPIDVFPTRFKHAVKSYIPRALKSWYIERNLTAKFDHELYGLKPKHDVLGAHATINDELPNKIAYGMIEVKPNIARFEGSDVVFVDGSVAHNIDHVILSTGYEIDFPVVENGNLIKVNDNSVKLYKYMYPLHMKHNTLAVLGLIQPTGSIMPIAELQARVFMSMLSGENKLPTSREMAHDVADKQEAMRKQFVASTRHTIQVDHIGFMDELAKLIGCCPSFWDLVFKDPVLAWHVSFGPCAPYVYRIVGPHPWSGARDALLKLDYRVQRGIKPGGALPAKSTVSFPVLFVLSIILLYLLCTIVF